MLKNFLRSSQLRKLRSRSWRSIETIWRSSSWEISMSLSSALDSLLPSFLPSTPSIAHGSASSFTSGLFRRGSMRITLERLSSLPSGSPLLPHSHLLPLYIRVLRSPSLIFLYSPFSRCPLINIDFDGPSFVGRFLTALYRTRLKPLLSNHWRSFLVIFIERRFKITA